MKKFQFKLQSVLKLKEFREKEIKQELGQIVHEILKLKEMVSSTHSEINFVYEQQEKMAKDNAINIDALKYFAWSVDVKNKHLEHLHVKIDDEQKKYELKIEELAQARGEVKLLEKMKEKKMIEYNKIKNRMEINQMEENVNIRRYYLIE